MNLIHIAPNRPLFVSLQDPEGEWDEENRRGVYQTITGHTLHLPRPAVVKLNLVGPKAGEEIEITEIWDGRQGSPREWSIRLSNRTEKARADAEAAATPPGDFAAAVEQMREQIRPITAPTPIRTTTKEAQPGLFDTRGTGTYGPMPAARAYAAPKLVNRRPPSLPQIPANVAFREVSAWVAAELRANNLQWGDEAQKNMVCTVFIAEYKAGRIGPWER